MVVCSVNQCHGWFTQVVAKSDDYCQAEQRLQAEVSRLKVKAHLRNYVAIYIHITPKVLQSYTLAKMHTVIPQAELQERGMSLGTVRGEKIAAEQQMKAAEEQINGLEVLKSVHK